ncbi:MAG TPA: choice-of-anchor D domain-containing protein [Kofleriaceae bacterium]
MGKRLLAVVVVIASACTALTYSVTTQKSIAISNNPYMYPGPGTQMFVLSPQNPGDDDILQSIDFDNCSSQWKLDTTIDPQQPVLGAHVCSGTIGSAQLIGGDDLVSCPRNYTFAVQYAGTLPGISSCNVLINSTPANMGSAINQVTLMLTGSGSAVGGISVTPMVLDFQDVQINTLVTSTTKIQVTNNGSAGSATVTGVQTGDAAFTISPSITSFSLGAGSSALFNVSCQPPSLGQHSGMVTFTSGTSVGSTQLACNGIDSMVTVTPTPVTFPNTLVGRAPPNQTVTIAGFGNAVIESVTLDSDAIAAGVTIVSNPAGMTVGAGKNVVLGYSAAAMHAAGPLGVLAVKVDVDMTPHNVGISGQALVGGVGTNPASVDFGAVCAGDKVTKDVEVYADEPGDVMVMALTKPTAPFDAVAVDALPKQLNGNHSGPSVTVRASLMPAMPGNYMDSFAVTSNVPNMGTTEVQLRGIGLAPGIAATPNVVHFGTAAMGTTTSIQQIQLTNCGTTDLDFMSVAITGGFAGEFILIGANPPRTLKPTESEVFMVAMQPHAPGYKTAQLVITHSAGTSTAELDGTGEGGNKDRETYYACSTGHGAALWPIALALLLLRRRRRQ